MTSLTELVCYTALDRFSQRYLETVRKRETETDRQSIKTERETETDRQTGRQADRQTEHKDREGDRYR